MLKVLKSYLYLTKSSLAALFLVVTLLTFTTKIGQAEATPATLGMQMRQQAELLISSLKNTATAISSASTAGSTAGLFAKENLLDGLAWAIAKQVASDITRSLIDWVNSGFAGSPAFVTDLEGLLVNSADQAVGQFIDDELGEIGDLLCSPFALDVRVALSISYAEARSNEPASCTLTEVEDNLEGFLNGTVDSWDQWFQVTTNPQNTPYGAYLDAESEMYARIQGAQERTLTEANWGNGFLSKKICEEVNGAFGGDGVQSGARYGETQGARAETAATAREGGSNCVISTPGVVISEQINKSLGLGQDALIEADEINELIGALLSQIALQAVQGINGLLGMSNGTGYTDYGYNGLSYTDALELDETSLDFSVYRAEMTNSYNRELGFLNLMNTTRTSAEAQISILEEQIADDLTDSDLTDGADIAAAKARIVELKALIVYTGQFATSTASSAAALLGFMQRYDTAATSTTYSSSTGTTTLSVNAVRRDVVLDFVRFRSDGGLTEEYFIETKRIEWSRILNPIY